MPTFPTSRLLKLSVRCDVEILSGTNNILNSNQLQVGKAGLPPLFLFGERLVSDEAQN